MFRRFDFDPIDLFFGSLFSGVVIAVFIGSVCGAVYFWQTTQTGPCARAGGAASYQPDYVQCGNGERIIYRKAPVELDNYKVEITNRTRSKARP